MLDTRGLNVASTKLPTIAITCVWPSRTGPGSTNCSPDSASTASSERRAKGRRARAHFTAFYYNSGTQGAQFLLYSWSFLLLPYDTVTTVGVSAVAQPPCIPNVYSRSRRNAALPSSAHQCIKSHYPSLQNTHIRQALPRRERYDMRLPRVGMSGSNHSVITHHKRFRRTT